MTRPKDGATACGGRSCCLLSSGGPLVYLELLGAVAIGYLFFGEVPDTHTWLGVLAIVLAGSILLQRTPAD